MRENFQNIDAKKLEIVHEIKSAYDEGKISLEEARKSLKDRVQHLAPYEIAIIEQEMVVESETSALRKISKLCWRSSRMFWSQRIKSFRKIIPSPAIVGKMPK